MCVNPALTKKKKNTKKKKDEDERLAGVCVKAYLHTHTHRGITHLKKLTGKANMYNTRAFQVHWIIQRR